MYLPLIKADGQMEEKVIETVPEGRERKLFIDDEAALIEGGKTMMTSLRYEAHIQEGSCKDDT